MAAVLSGPVVIFVPCVLVLAPVVVGVVVVCVVVLGGGGGGHCDVCVDQLIHGFSCPSWFFTASSVHCRVAALIVFAAAAAAAVVRVLVLVLVLVLVPVVVLVLVLVLVLIPVLVLVLVRCPYSCGSALVY